MWNSLRARVALLEILRNVPHRAKLHMLLPLLKSFVSGNQTRIWDKENNALDVAYLQLLLEAFDRTVVPVLNEPGSGSWSTLIRLVRFISTNGKTPSLLFTLPLKFNQEKCLYPCTRQYSNRCVVAYLKRLQLTLNARSVLF